MKGRLHKEDKTIAVGICIITDADWETDNIAMAFCQGTSQLFLYVFNII